MITSRRLGIAVMVIAAGTVCGWALDIRWLRGTNDAQTTVLTSVGFASLALSFIIGETRIAIAAVAIGALSLVVHPTTQADSSFDIPSVGTALALTVLSSGRIWGNEPVRFWCAAAAMAIALLGLTGHSYGLSGLYFRTMAPHTALMIGLTAEALRRGT